MKPVAFVADPLRMFEVVSFFSDAASALKARGHAAEVVVMDRRNRLLFRWGGFGPVTALDPERAAGPGARFEARDLEDIYRFSRAAGRLSDAPQDLLAGRAERIAEVWEGYLRTADPGLIVIWGGSLPVHRIIALTAGRQGREVLCLENGYFPATLQVGFGGANIDNPWLRRLGDDEFWDALGRKLRPVAPGGPADRCGPWLKAAQFVLALGYKRAAYQRTHPEVYISNTLLQGVASQLRPLWDRWVHGGPGGAPVLPDPYYFLPLQVHDDSQILLHSPWVRTMEQMVEVVHSAVGKAAPAARLVVKEHPVDAGRRAYARLRRRYPDVVWLRRGSVPDLVRRCRAVVTVNSTVGIEALKLGKPVITLGEAFYGLPGIVHSVRDEADLVRVLKAQDLTVEAERVDRYLDRLAKRFLPCAWRKREPAGPENLAEFIVQWTGGPGGMHPGFENGLDEPRKSHIK